MHNKRLIVELKTQINNPPSLPQIKSFTSIFQGLYPSVLVVTWVVFEFKENQFSRVILNGCFSR